MKRDEKCERYKRMNNNMKIWQYFFIITMGLIKTLTTLFCFLALATSGEVQGARDTQQLGMVRKEPVWRLTVVDHPDVASKYGDLTLSGNPDHISRFLTTNRVSMHPEDATDQSNVLKIFNDFNNVQALGIDIKLECSCCPLKCKLTISISW